MTGPTINELLQDAVSVLDQTKPPVGHVSYSPFPDGVEESGAVLGLTPDRLLLLAIPIPEDDEPLIKNLRHLRFDRQEHNLRGESVVCIEVRLLTGKFQQQFLALAAEIIEAVNDMLDYPSRAVAFAVGRWEELMRGTTERRHAEEVGLFGELLVVEHLAKLDQLQRSALWHSTGELHDFANRQEEIEVKTTMSADSSVVEVSLLDQLADLPGQGLTMVHVRIEESDDGRTTSELIDSINSQITDPNHFDKILHDQGWRIGRDERRFRELAIDLYEIDETFPRLTPNDVNLPSGIDLKYSIDLAHAQANRLQEQEAADFLQDFANGEIP